MDFIAIYFGCFVFLAELECQHTSGEPQQWGTINIVNWGAPPSKWKLSRTVSKDVPRGVWSSSAWSAGTGDCVVTDVLPTHTGSVTETGHEERGRRKRGYHSSEETKTQCLIMRNQKIEMERRNAQKLQ